MSPEFFDVWPDGTLCIIPMNRSIVTVMEERIKIAMAFADLTDEEPSPAVLTGSAGLAKMEFLKEEGLEITDSITLQDKIDVFNNLKADDLVWEYVEKRLESFFEKRPG